MTTENTTTTGQGTPTIDGLREALALAAKREDQAVERQAKQRQAKVDQLQRLQAGYVNDKGVERHNPGLIPESVRPGTEGEQIGGKDHKGWVVEVECETCGEIFLANTQDAFQKRFCNKACKPTKAGATTGTKKARELLTEYSVEQLSAMLAEAEETTEDADAEAA